MVEFVLIFLLISTWIKGYYSFHAVDLVRRKSLPLCSMNLFNKWLQDTKQSLLSEYQKTNNLNDQSGISSPLNYRKPVEDFFNSWNLRDMETALLSCDEDCTFEDTLFPRIYQGRDEIRIHLYNVANSLPTNFQFIIDEIAEDRLSGNIGIQWHVEVNNQTIPFTRGASMYKVNEKGLIIKGFDVPEPVLKVGAINLQILKIVNKLLIDPIRLIPFFAWIFYIWFLFLSNIPSGVNVFHMTSDTLNEVINLSLNFWLLLPLTFPQFAPSVHPMLEGIFNIVLIWSLLFAGFVIDGKKENGELKNNENSMIGTLAGMQLLTNAFYLPYLFSRENYSTKTVGAVPVTLNQYEKFFESKLFPVITGSLAVLFLAWSFYGRYEEFGNISDRLESFQHIVSQDRLTFSFLFDGFYYSLFQGWLISEDYQRRNQSQASLPIYAKLGQFVPLFGLVIYFLFRPKLQKDTLKNLTCEDGNTSKKQFF